MIVNGRVHGTSSKTLTINPLFTGCCDKRCMIVKLQMVWLAENLTPTRNHSWLTELEWQHHNLKKCQWW